MNHHFQSVAARTVVVIGSLAVATAGCGGSTPQRGHPQAAAAGKAQQAATVHRLTPAATETQIAELQQRVGLSVTAVHCPRVAVRDGRSFTCVSTLATGGPIRTTVTPTNVRLGDARFQFPLRSAQ